MNNLSIKFLKNINNFNKTIQKIMINQNKNMAEILFLIYLNH